MFAPWHRAVATNRQYLHRAGIQPHAERLYDACWKVFPRTLMVQVRFPLRIDLDASSMGHGLCIRCGGYMVKVFLEEGPGPHGTDYPRTAQRALTQFRAAGLVIPRPKAPYRKL